VETELSVSTKPRHAGKRREKKPEKRSRVIRRTVGAALMAITVGALSNNSGFLARTLWHGTLSVFTGPRPRAVPLRTAADTVAAALDVPGATGGGLDVPGATGGRAVALRGGLAVTAVHVAGDPCEGAPGWRVPLGPGRLGRPPAPDRIYQWSARHGGQEVSGTRVNLTLQNHGRVPVTVTGISAMIKGRVRPVRGAYILPYGQCGGGGPQPRFLVAKLDDFPPQV
jgi:hypothetical protein